MSPAGIHRFHLRRIVWLLGAVAGLVAAGGARAAGPCRPLVFEDVRYVVCEVDARRYAIEMFWKDRNGEAFGSLGRFASSETGKRAVFAMNGGMYHEGGTPVGLYVERRERLRAANLAAGPGNFHMKPNGVFFIAGDQVGVEESARFVRQRRKVDFATQSGPMLVVDGRLHRRFSADGASLKIRNGVGARDAHTAVFAISDRPVSFGSFARLFRDRLGCRNALYLDGSISSLYAPQAGRTDRFMPVGPIIAARPR